MRFLMFEMKTVCYNSYLYFADALSKSLSALGHEIEMYSSEAGDYDGLEAYMGQHFDAIIDFNSDLPRALLDDDSYFLNHIDCPFIDIILDHPLYHHDSLKHKLNNFHVICLDENHKNYILKYYPHIKSVSVTPMTGELAFGKELIDWENFDNREYDLLFSGTYTDPVRIERSIHAIPKFLQENVHHLIDMLLADSSLTIEQAVETMSESEIYDYIKSDVPLHTQSFYLADAYVRALNRKNLVKELDKCEHPLHLFGSLWDELELNHAILHREVPFNLSFTLFAKSKISINIMPNFKAGSHDRVFSAQLNGAVSLTDPTASLLKEYTDNKNILYYKLDDMNGLSEIIDTKLKAPEELLKIAQGGYDIAAKNHTWAKIADVVLKLIN